MFSLQTCQGCPDVSINITFTHVGYFLDCGSIYYHLLKLVVLHSHYTPGCSRRKTYIILK